MRCQYCGQEIPDGSVTCPYCGSELQMVPDYSPLEDMLAAGIVGSMEEDSSAAPQERTTRNTSSISDEERMRRRNKKRLREKKRKRRRTILILVAVLIVALVILGIVLYQNSYAGIVGKGNRALEAGDLESAIEYFEKAIDKNEERPEAYTGLSKVYIAQDDLEAATNVFTKAISSQPENSAIYEACIQYYMDTEQQAEIPLLLADAAQSVQEELSSYIIAKPEFSLDPDKTYDEVQEVSLTCLSGLTIYYTDDGESPTIHSIPYTGPIQLSEGETEIRAIAVDDREIPSLEVARSYTVELPIEDAPAVSPSTGQYDSATNIEIMVPTGYTAYYTMDGTDPTVASEAYEGPIAMPEGETLFKAVLVSATGRLSGITTRNYMLDTSSGYTQSEDTYEEETTGESTEESENGEETEVIPEETEQ